MNNYFYFTYKRGLFLPKEKYCLVSNLSKGITLAILEILSKNNTKRMELITPSSAKEKEKFLEICIQTKQSDDKHFCEVEITNAIGTKSLVEFKIPQYFLEEKANIQEKEGE